MFKVLEGRKRRVFSPAAMAASIAAHLLLLGGATYAAANDTGPAKPGGIVIDTLPPIPIELLTHATVEPTPPSAPVQPGAPDAPTAGAGTRMDLETPNEAPDGVVDELPGVQPVNVEDYGDGITGRAIGTPRVMRQSPTGRIELMPGRMYVPRAEDVEEQPVLDRDGLSRTMERYYPPVLARSRVAGRAVVELIVDEDGSVRPNSARVLDTTHPAFAEATLQAVERFRFQPAKMMGIPVPVLVTIPINWTIPE
jgi:periplasmic protein TonB